MSRTAVRSYRPVTPSRRHMTRVAVPEDVWAKPMKSLTRGKRRTGARNARGRITTRFRGGGHKRKLRDIDFYFLDKKGVPARVERLERDPNRSGYVALVCYRDGERRYVLAPQGIEKGQEILMSEDAPLTPANRLPLAKFPVGSLVYNVETTPEGGAKLVRSAGVAAEVIGHDAGYTFLKMPSSEVRKISSRAWASVGAVSHPSHGLVTIGKAGRSRWLGRRPKVRGAAMNPVDHPHGGGEGRAGRGHRRQRTKWGKPAGKGQKTRKPKKYSRNLIVARRKVGPRRKQ
ncbi:MAG: 50S ribosomal protein L2 [Candidatus Parcubacteria bacterium]|nr:MAG: 50S ribosomal protein L2 [Candidatus Parcubacteria bacterium]